MAQTGVVISIFNRKDAGLSCITSVLSDVPEGNPIVIVDDHSTDGIQGYLKEFEKRCVLVMNPQNMGFSCSANKGFRKARDLGAKNIIHLNGDVQVFPGWFESLTRVAEEYPDAGVVGPTYANNFDLRWRDQTRRTGAPGSALCARVDFLLGHCLLIREDLWNKGFRWDKKISPVGPFHLDVCLFSRAKGFKNYIATGSWAAVLDCPPGAKWILDLDPEKCFARGREYVRKKWKKKFFNVLLP